MDDTFMIKKTLLTRPPCYCAPRQDVVTQTSSIRLLFQGHSHKRHLQLWPFWGNVGHVSFQDLSWKSKTQVCKIHRLFSNSCTVSHQFCLFLPTNVYYLWVFCLLKAVQNLDYFQQIPASSLKHLYHNSICVSLFWALFLSLIHI